MRPALPPEKVVAVYERAARQYLEGRITFVIGDLLHLPFADGAFDAVLSTYSACPLYDPVAGVRELYRVIKPGGTAGDSPFRRAGTSPDPTPGRLGGSVGLENPGHLSGLPPGRNTSGAAGSGRQAPIPQIDRCTPVAVYGLLGRKTGAMRESQTLRRIKP